MHNKVVFQAAKAMDSLGIAVLRFNFRGGCEEARVTRLIAIGAPVNSSDFSYLLQCAKPKLFVHGSNDEHGAIAKVRELVKSLPGESEVMVVDGDADGGAVDAQLEWVPFGTP